MLRYRLHSGTVTVYAQTAVTNLESALPLCGFKIFSWMFVVTAAAAAGVCATWGERTCSGMVGLKVVVADTAPAGMQCVVLLPGAVWREVNGTLPFCVGIGPET